MWDTNVNRGARETRTLANNQNLGRKVSRTALAGKDTQGIMGVPLARSRFHGKGRALALTYSWVKSMRFCKSMSSLYALMLLLIKKYSWSLIQSLKTNASTPAVSSRKKIIPRNTENYEKRNTQQAMVTGVSGKGCNCTQLGPISKPEPSVS